MRITVKNPQLGTEVRLNLPKDGQLSPAQVSRARRVLGAAPGLPVGPLGEAGPQRPPERPNLEFVFKPSEDGGATYDVKIVGAEASA